jgi:hypothetical protein
MADNWQDDLISLATWALKSLDVRYSYLYAEKAKEVLESPGILFALETSFVLAIYEAAIGKGYVGWKTIEHEKPYPGEEGKNPRRADLALKEEGRGKNWIYVEVKYYAENGKYQIGMDIEKLKSIDRRSQRWMVIYRVRPKEGSSRTLEQLLKRNFNEALSIERQKEIDTRTRDWEPGICEVCLARVT